MVRQYEQSVLARTSAWFTRATSPDSQADTFNHDLTLHLTETDLDRFRQRLREVLDEAAAASDPASERALRVWGFGLVTRTDDATPHEAQAGPS